MEKNTRKKTATLSAVELASAETGNRPPQAPEVEESLIGAMLVEAECLYQAVDALKESSFYDPKLRLIFAAMVRLFREHSAVDVMTVTERLRRDGVLEEVGGVARLAGLTQLVGSAANTTFYIKILQQKTIQRDLIAAGYGILRKAFDETCDVDRLIDESQRDVYNAVQGNMRREYVALNDALNRAMERMEWAQKTEGLTGIPSGFPSLDRITRGWQAGNLIVIGARPGHGKSAIALNMAGHAAICHRIPTAFFSLEMQDIELADRIIGTETGLSSGKRKGRLKMDDAEWKQLERALQVVAGAPLYIDETSGLTIMEFRSKIKRMALEKGIRLAIVDYIQLMHASGNFGTNRAQEIADISRQLKETAKELRIPIIALAQLNRNLMERQKTTNGRPVLSDLKDSGSIEQDADMVLFIHRPGLLGLSDSCEDLAELVIAKNRSGEMGVINLKFDGERTKFTESGESLADYAARVPSSDYSPFNFDREVNYSPFRK